jgi:hypothetical protein
VIHSYCAYGLPLESQTAIAGLSPGASNHEAWCTNPIEVAVGTCPAWAEAALRLPTEPVYPDPTTSGRSGLAFQLSRLGGGQFFQLSYADGSQFLVDADTRKICGRCPPALTQEDLVTYLVGPVLGFVLRQRGVLALHASSFSGSGFAFALCGGSGTGKSTSSAALALRGVPILCEDITALRERNSALWAAPGYPRVNLWPESAANLFGTPLAIPRITATWDKRFLPLDGTLGGFDCQERQLAAIYLLAARSVSDDAPRIEEVSLQEAVLQLVQNTYMNYLLDKEQRAAEFDIAARLVSGTVVRRLVPHSDPTKLTAMCELLQVDSASIAAKLGSATASQRL